MFLRNLLVRRRARGAASLVLACTSNLHFPVIAGMIGVSSPSDNEAGPFLSIEQATLAHIVPAAPCVTHWTHSHHGGLARVRDALRC